MRYLLSYCLCIFLFSCTKQGARNVIVETNECYPEVSDTHITDALCIDKIHLHDSSLVVINRKVAPFFYVYDKNTFSLQGAFGAEGSGPGDFLFPFFLGTMHDGGEAMPVYDVNLASFKHINLESAMKSESDAIKSVPMPVSLIGSPDLYQMADSLYLGNIDSGEGLFFMYHPEKDKQEWIDFPASLLPPEDDFTVMNMNRITVNERQGKVASGMCFYNKVFLYQLDGTLIKEIQIGEKEIFPRVVNQHYISEDNLLCCKDVQSTEDFIYVLMQDIKEKDTQFPVHATSRILVFDWDLNYVKTYRLPHYATTLLPDKDSDRVFYTAINKEGDTEVHYFNDRTKQQK